MRGAVAVPSFALTVPPVLPMVEGSVSTTVRGTTKVKVPAIAQVYSMEVSCLSSHTMEEQQRTSWVLERWSGQHSDSAADPLRRYKII